MTAFDQAWDVVKDFKFMGLEAKKRARERAKKGVQNMEGYFDALSSMLTMGGFNPQTKEIFANLDARDLHYKDGYTTDEEKEKSILNTLRHESDHAALDSVLVDELQPSNVKIPYSVPVREENMDELSEEFNDRYTRAQEYAVQGVDTMRRLTGPREPGLRISRVRAPNRRFRELARYDGGFDSGYSGTSFSDEQLRDLIDLEENTAASAMNYAMGRRARENARRMMDDGV